jgi:hypothetical protein
MKMRELIDLVTERAVGGPQLTIYEGPTPQELQTAHQTDPDGRVLGLLADDRLFIWPASFADPRDIMERFGVNRYRAIPLEMGQHAPTISGGSPDYVARAAQTVQESEAVQKLYGPNVRVATTNTRAVAAT